MFMTGVLCTVRGAQVFFQFCIYRENSTRGNLYGSIAKIATTRIILVTQMRITMLNLYF